MAGGWPGPVAPRGPPSHSLAMTSYRLQPDPDDPRLTRRVAGIDQDGRAIETAVVVERPLTLFLNGQEIVTMMTIGDHPDCLAVGYLLNQNMLRPDDRIEGIEHDEELGVVVVRTLRRTDYEDKLRRKKLDMIAANRVGDGLGFETADNALDLYWEGGSKELPRAGKDELARALIACVAERFQGASA